MNHCDTIIIDNVTKKHRQCKKIFKFDILNKKYCIFHANILYKKKIITIQKVFRAYKLRKKFKYFIALPFDLQHKIIIYTRYDLYENKKNKKITEIILNKIDIFIKKYFNLPQQVNYLFGAIKFYSFQVNNIIDLELYVNTHPNANYLINHVLYLFYLLNKYQPIIVKEKDFIVITIFMINLLCFLNYT